MPIHCFLFEIQIIKNGFTGPKSFWDFRETGTRAHFCVLCDVTRDLLLTWYMVHLPVKEFADEILGFTQPPFLTSLWGWGGVGGETLMILEFYFVIP